MTAVEIIDFVANIINEINRVKVDIESKIAEIDEDIARIQNEAHEHTSEWVDKQMKKLETKQQNLQMKLDKWVEKQTKSINDWKDKILKKIIDDEIKAALAKINLLK